MPLTWDHVLEPNRPGLSERLARAYVPAPMARRATRAGGWATTQQQASEGFSPAAELKGREAEVVAPHPHREATVLREPHSQDFPTSASLQPTFV